MTPPNNRNERLEIELSNAYREVDKILITVASTVLAVTIALIGNIDEPAGIWTIRTSWILLFVTVISVVCSLLVEQKDKRKRIENNFEGLQEASLLTDATIKYLNFVSFISFLGGLLFLGCFLWMNTN